MSALINDEYPMIIGLKFGSGSIETALDKHLAFIQDESVNNILTSVYDFEHTRHRKSENAFANIAGLIVAYHFIEQKPSIFIKNPTNEYNSTA